jgi:hypothetical protein
MLVVLVRAQVQVRISRGVETVEPVDTREEIL